jgi:hypothetical protein
MYVNIRSELVPSPRAYAVRPERRKNENYKILVFSFNTVFRSVVDEDELPLEPEI